MFKKKQRQYKLDTPDTNVAFKELESLFFSRLTFHWLLLSAYNLLYEPAFDFFRWKLDVFWLTPVGSACQKTCRMIFNALLKIMVSFFEKVKLGQHYGFSKMVLQFSCDIGLFPVARCM